MDRKYFLTLLALVTLQANAAWTVIQEDLGFFYDPDTMRVSGQRVNVWGLQNYPKALPLGSRLTMSKALQIEADCLRTQFRTVSYYFKTEAMGEGETIAGYPLTPSSPFGKWRTPEANSFELALFNKVCRKPEEPTQSIKDSIDPAVEEIIDESSGNATTL